MNNGLLILILAGGAYFLLSKKGNTPTYFFLADVIGLWGKKVRAALPPTFYVMTTDYKMYDFNSNYLGMFNVDDVIKYL